MKGVSHATLGVCGVLAIQGATGRLAPSLVGLLPLAGVAALAALIPDLDSDQSTIRQATGTARRQGCLGAAASFAVRLSGGHRGITHSLLGWFLVSLLSGMYFRGNMIALAISIGYLSHLVADAVTVEGIPLFWPVWRRRICLLPAAVAIRTGSMVEQIVVIAAGVAAGLLWLHAAV